MRQLRAAALLPALALSLTEGCQGCRSEPAAGSRPIAPEQCERLIDHYTELALVENVADASSALIFEQKVQVRELAKRDPALAQCAAQLTEATYACAISATTPESFEACLSR